MLSVSSTSLSTDEAAIVDHAAELLKLVNLSMNDQLTIEHAIGLIAINRNCTRPRAAQILNKIAFPQNF
ncbi:MULTISPECIES: hypothetical protein [Leptolyngbya]|jgi:hypothetical protein|uniref:hypothetical protein n=1 Tax=Leptolyngbya TaxID=47251 RepID=UPI00037CBD97|nr:MULTISPECIES: hypothetical protein [Leptolyngbya]MBD2371123.1 hypothetical protein [Leptolyngbya sp. FACHB-161]MBD2377591.1 hypothetical protein [Leptolyngbya sp. FACHB-238]MBD2402044.1 hypothetical protein [Leptolyngbya sp. FACHB-239]MBD2408563.1 hypothetical protein [Leptolyngbya sp. FACHB-402]BAS60467.1 hypothetical protein LBWT_Y0550 [Leptolyngbya boryana IAM M-101]